MNGKEFAFAGTKLNGFAMLFANLALTIASIGSIVWGISVELPALIVTGILLLIVTFFLWPGFIMLEPNEATVMLFLVNTRGHSREQATSG